MDSCIPQPERESNESFAGMQHCYSLPKQGYLSYKSNTMYKLGYLSYKSNTMYKLGLKIFFKGLINRAILAFIY